jgi:hypothetical protein
MAVFLLKAKNGGSYVPPAASGTMFSDVPASHFAAAYIEKLAVDGVTSGCGGGKYCPDGSTTRGQMAVFMLKTKEGSSYAPPAPTGMFSDVPTSHTFGAFIEELSRRGITSGCGGGMYCPDTATTRGQMAVFLKRTFGLQ